MNFLNQFSIKNILLLFSLLLFANNAIAQDLLNSRKTSYYTYIFKITDNEAKNIYLKDREDKDIEYKPSLFQNLVDSFPTDKKYNKTLPNGHYIEMNAQYDYQSLKIYSIPNFEVYVLNNTSDLVIMILDKNGKIVSNADVYIKGKKLRFNNKSNAYIDKKSNKNGILSVTYYNHTTFYDVEREWNDSRLNQITAEVYNRIPNFIILKPLKFVIRLPYDVTISEKFDKPFGSIFYIKKFFLKLACIINKDNCEELEELIDLYDWYDGYIVTNKPKYFIGDTVRVKAFIKKINEKSFNDSVKVELYDYSSTKIADIATIKPYSPGAYSFEFALSSINKLKLDKHYTIELLDKKGKTIQSVRFEYEDYHLKKNKLEVTVFNNSNHYQGIPFKFQIKAFDDNDLALMDARLEISVLSKQKYDFFDHRVFVPDTILKFEKVLLPQQYNDIYLPDSVFPKANFDYEIQFKLRTSDNEFVSEKKEIHYFYNKQEFNYDVFGDSVKFNYYENGLVSSTRAKLYSLDYWNNKKLIYEGIFPCVLPHNNNIYNYAVEYNKTFITIKSNYSGKVITVDGQRTKDSLKLRVVNDMKIPFKYDVYNGDKCIQRGYSNSLTLNLKTSLTENIYLSIAYIYKGKADYLIFPSEYFKNKLNINVEQPKIVYPGKKTSIELTVTDSKNKPVKNVDLTAYSMTKKFENKPPSFWYYLGGNTKLMYSDFKIKKSQSVNTILSLNYDWWKNKSGFDTIEYFKFTYPTNGLYRFDYIPADSITQFAPFVFDNGKNVDVQMIFLNDNPIYFCWLANNDQYSFSAKPGFNNIKIRTKNHYISIDSVQFHENQKTILSVDINHISSKIRITTADSILSDEEFTMVVNHTLPVKISNDCNVSYFKNNDRCFNVNYSNDYYRFIGPVKGDVSYSFSKSLKNDFIFKPNTLYLIYRDSLITSNKLPSQFPSKFVFGRSKDITDIVNYDFYRNTTPNIKEPNRSLINYALNPSNYSSENSNLIMQLGDNKYDSSASIAGVFLYNTDSEQFKYIFSNFYKKNLYVEPGNYNILVLYNDETYIQEDSVKIIENGLNYISVNPSKTKLTSPNLQLFLSVYSDILKKKYYKKPDLIFLSTIYRNSILLNKKGNCIIGNTFNAQYNDVIRYVKIDLYKNNQYLKSTFSNSVGNFEFEKLDTGSYVLSISDSSIVNSTINNVYVKPNMISYVSLEAKSIFYRGEVLPEVIIMIDKLIFIDKAKTTAGSTISYGFSINTSDIQNKNDDQNNIYIDGICVSNTTQKTADEQELLRKYTEQQTRKNSSDLIYVKNFPFPANALFVINGNVFSGDISTFDWDLVAKIEVVTTVEGTKIYGESGKNGVVLITLKQGAIVPGLIKNKGTEYDSNFYTEAMKSSKIRTNFSDYAFWQPRLKTDKNGKASFEVTFPDDVTAWETFYLAMNNKGQLGQSQGIIKSYKPLIAELNLPYFLVNGDSAFAIGKVLNYTSDTIPVVSHLEIDGKNQFQKQNSCINALIDTLPIVAGNDSLKVKYYFENNSGFFDGEIRDIPVFPVGIELNNGWFCTLNDDTTLKIQSTIPNATLTITACSNVLEVIENEAYKNINYQYLCNEQISSKIKSLIALKRVRRFFGKEFNKDENIKTLIKMLSERVNTSGLWGWWVNSEDNFWISLHVVEALLEAQKEGFSTLGMLSNKETLLINMYQGSLMFDNRIRLLRIMNAMNINVKYSEFIYELENSKQDTALYQILDLCELKQSLGYKINLDFLKKYQKTNLFGNIFYSDKATYYYSLNNEIQITLQAYRLLRNSGVEPIILRKIRNYFLENRRNDGYWNNTYESAQIIETILPDLLQKTQNDLIPFMKITGDIKKEVNTFPFQMTLKPGESISIQKSGEFPVYFSVYETYWDSNPDVKKGDFEIKTHLSNQSDTLQAGVPIKLIVDVTINKSADYLMIKVPIPAGCAYGEKRNYYYRETHREYFRNETAIFCQYLRAGTYQFEIDLLPRYTGVYTLNPAKIEQMYFPVFNANTSIERVTIE